MADSAPRVPGARAKRHRKYGNEPVEIDGVRFPSKKEARRWGELKLLEKGGVIRNLKRQEKYALTVNGQLVCNYVCDFQYEEASQGKWVRVVEDVKSEATRKNSTFRLKEKLLQAVHGIKLRIV
jgi:hypothetical protein